MSEPLDDFCLSLPRRDGEPWLEPCRLTGRLGAGATSTVYLGFHENLQKLVAVKVLRPDTGAHRLVERFRREAHLAARIEDERLLRVYDVREWNGVHYLVLEYMDRGSAGALVRMHAGLTTAVAAWIAGEAARGLGAAHVRGVVHRDVKPDNIFVAADGRVKLGDLGLARAVSVDEGLTLDGCTLGTPAFMAPEQWQTPAVGPTADVFALGATLYALLTGESPPLPTSPFDLGAAVRSRPCLDPRDKVVGVDAALAALIRRATAPQPQSRFADAEEFAAALFQVTRADAEVGRAALRNLLARIANPGDAPAHGQKTAITKVEPPAGVSIRTGRLLTMVALGGAAIGMGSWTMMAGARSRAEQTTETAAAAAGPATPQSTAVDEKPVTHQEPSRMTPAAPPTASSAAALPTPRNRHEDPSMLTSPTTSPPPPSPPPASLVDARTDIEFVRIEPGEFLFGKRPHDRWALAAEPEAHTEVVAEAFYLSRREVSMAEFRRFQPDHGKPNSNLRLPAVGVSHGDALGFCQQFGYRLPTALQWEFAARAGEPGTWSWGNDIAAAVRHANGRSAGEGPTRRAAFPGDDGFAELAPCGSFSPNGFGLHDMLGNAAEWCADAMPEELGKAASFVVRGGSWRDGPDRCRVSAQRAFADNYRADDVGFRVVLPDWRSACVSPR